MNHLHQRLSELTALLATASPDRLLELARAVRAAVPPHLEDLGSVADSIVGQASAAASMDRELLVALIEGDLAGMAELLRLAGPEAAPEAPPARVLPAWVDGGMLADFHDAQRFGLAEIEELLLNGGSSETDRAKLARILHTLKGEAGTVGFADLEELYHALEDHLDGVTDLRPLTDDVFAVKDWVLAAVPRLVDGEPAPDGRQELLDRLRAVAEPAPAPTPPPAPAFQTKGMISQDPEVLALFGEFYDESQESLAQADELLLSFEMGAPDAPAVDALFRVFHTIKGLAGFLDLGSIGSLAHAAETLLDLAREDLSTLDGGRNDLLLRTTAMIRKILIATRDRLSQGGGEVHVDGAEQLHGALVSARQHRASPVEAPRPSSPEGSGGGSEDEGGGEAERKSPALVRETIKVDLARVDNLVETIGELVIIEAMVTSGGELSHISQRARHQLSQLSKIVRDLQRQGLALRMVPLRGVFQKMSRLVRDLSRRSNKPIQLELAGQDAEMDRSLAERLGDPLVHMIRNAVDHGVESVEKRRAAGKPEQATLRLRAFHEGGNINIELSDDGKGLDRDAILSKAVGRGLVAPTAVLSDREVHELIFHPGFSTAEKVTELSGRGVGMDVVKKTVDDLRGRIQISTELGRGTTFRLVLPLTLAIIDGMLLVIGGRRYVLPTLAIVESLQPARSQVHQFATGMRVLDMRGTQLPLVDLASLLGVDSVASRDPALGFVVVVDGLNSRFGLVVDDLIGQQQVVIKHIDSSVNSLGLFSGAAILTDGHVGLILNPTALRSEEHASRGTTSLGSEVG